MRLSRTCLLLGLVPLGGCSTEAKSVGEIHMFFDGQIDDDNAKGLSREFAKHPHGTVILTVRSPGGDARSALLLGDAIRQFRVSMIVN